MREGEDFAHHLALLPKRRYRSLGGQRVFPINVCLSVGLDRLTVPLGGEGKRTAQQQPDGRRCGRNAPFGVELETHISTIGAIARAFPYAVSCVGHHPGG